MATQSLDDRKCIYYILGKSNSSLKNKRIETHFLQKWVVPEKIHTPKTDGILEILTGRGVKDPGNLGRRGGGG